MRKKKTRREMLTRDLILNSKRLTEKKWHEMKEDLIIRKLKLKGKRILGI